MAQGISPLEADRTRSGSGAAVPGPPPRAEALLESILQPDLSAADNEAARENVLQFFRILVEWDVAARRPEAAPTGQTLRDQSGPVHSSSLPDGSTP